MIDLRSDEMIKHVRCRCEQDAHVSLAGFPCDNSREHCFAHARVSDDNDVCTLANKIEIKHASDFAFQLLARFVMAAGLTQVSF